MQLKLSVVNTMTLRDAALWYVQNGFHVFPLAPRSKIPMPHSRGVKDATLNPAVVDLWWSLYPDANIGLAGGLAYDFADLDQHKENQDGVMSWLHLGGDFSRPMQTTPSGGKHVLLPHYTWAPYETNFVNRGAYLGLDMRTSNGYVVGAPSVGTGGRWTWQDGDHRDLEPNILSTLLDYSKPRYSASAPLTRPEPEQLYEWDLLALIGGLSPRHQAFLRQGVNWRPDQDDSAAAWEVLLVMFARGWSKERVAAVCEGSYLSAFAARHATGDPMAWLWRYTAASAFGEAQRQNERILAMLPEVAPAPEPDDNTWVVGDAPTADLGGISPGLQPYEWARDQILGLTNDPALPVNQELYRIFCRVAGAGLAKVQVRDLQDLAASGTRATVPNVRAAWSEAQDTLYERGRSKEDVEAENVFVVTQNQVYNRIARSFRKKEAFVVDHAPQFGGDKVETERQLLLNTTTGCPRVDDLTYHPGKPHGVIDKPGTGGRVQLFNTYMPSPCVPLEGDVSPWLGLLKGLDMEGGEEAENAVLDYLAHLIQNPGVKANHALLLGGAHGVGKDSLIYPITQILGDENVAQVGGEDLTGDFNEFISKVKLVVVQEIELGDHRDSRAVSAKIKPWFASPPTTLRINEKFVKPYSIPNLIQAIAFTNDSHQPIPMDAHERRWLAVWCRKPAITKESPLAAETGSWFSQYYDWLESGGLEAIYHYLKTRDLSTFRPKESPMQTPWTLRIKAAGRPPMEDWLVHKIAEGEGPFAFDVVRLKDIVPIAELARLSGELALRRPVNERSLSVVMDKLSCPPWQTPTGRWRILRDRQGSKEKGVKYWQTIFRCFDATNITATLEMSQEERELYNIDTRTKKVARMPNLPDWY